MLNKLCSFYEKKMNSRKSKLYVINTRTHEHTNKKEISIGSYFAWSDLALKRQRYILVLVGVIAMSDGDDNDSGDEFVEVLFIWAELFSSSCANVLFVSSFCIAVVEVVLSLWLHVYMYKIIICKWMSGDKCNTYV